MSRVMFSYYSFHKLFLLLYRWDSLSYKFGQTVSQNLKIWKMKWFSKNANALETIATFASTNMANILFHINYSNASRKCLVCFRSLILQQTTNSGKDYIFFFWISFFCNMDKKVLPPSHPLLFVNTFVSK